jgi:hippurate hydrolase
MLQFKGLQEYDLAVPYIEWTRPIGLPDTGDATGTTDSIVSRELAPGEFGVVTVGAMKVGSAPNVISDRGELLINVRAYDYAVRDKILRAIDRIVRAECQASGSPQEPTFETIATFPLTVNDPKVTEAVTLRHSAYRRLRG